MLQNLPVMHPQFQRQVEDFIKNSQFAAKEDLILSKVMNELPGYERMVRVVDLLFMFFITTSLSKYAHPLWFSIFVVIELCYY